LPLSPSVEVDCFSLIVFSPVVLSQQAHDCHCTYINT
jgi:hypothetical protein